MKLHIKDFKKHYTGEWDFNQFLQIDTSKEWYFHIPFIGNEELVLLQALDLYLFDLKVNFNDEPIHRPKIITSYISYLRDDKDYFSYSQRVISTLNFEFYTSEPPHERYYNIWYNKDIFNGIVDDYCNLDYTKTNYVLGADSSVKKFYRYIDGECTKVRENGKIVKFDIPKEVEKLGKDSNLIIVDDILGGGGTIKKIIEKVNPAVNITVIVGFTEDLEDFSNYPNVSLVAMTSLEKLKKSNKGE